MGLSKPHKKSNTKTLRKTSYYTVKSRFHLLKTKISGTLRFTLFNKKVYLAELGEAKEFLGNLAKYQQQVCLHSSTPFVLYL